MQFLIKIMILIVALSLLQFGGTLGITVTNALNNSRPRIGESITLSCRIAGGTFDNAKWWKEQHGSREEVYLTQMCLGFVMFQSRVTTMECDQNNFNVLLSDVQISDSGNWGCIADEQDATTMLRLDVLAPVNVQVKISNTTVNENDFVRFECGTSGGNPGRIEQYQWLWKKSGSTVERVIQDTDENSTHGGRVLEFLHIPFDKSGTFTCKAWNLGGMGQASTDLNVQYSPRTDPEVLIEYDVLGVIGKEVSFELFIIANPTPAATGYTWFKDDNILSNSSKGHEITAGSTFSKLRIKNVESSDFAYYMCSVKTSAFQAKVFKFQLHKAGPPSPPSEFRVVNSTAVSVTLSWTSEFSGGSEQRFFVQYKRSADRWDVASEVPKGGLCDPGVKQVVYNKVTNLESNVDYVFRVRSKNSDPYMISEFSNIAYCKTSEKPQTTVLGMSRTDNKITVRWTQVAGKYTAIKVKYCQTGTEDCINYTVPKPEDKHATFFVDVNKTYYYYMVIEDGGDVVYRSTAITEEFEVGDKINTVVVAVAGGLVGAVIVSITVVTVAVVIWKRGLVRWGKMQSSRPTNDTVDYGDTKFELRISRNTSVNIYENIEPVYENDIFHPGSKASHNPAQPEISRPYVPVERVIEEEHVSSVNDEGLYDCVEDPATRQLSTYCLEIVPSSRVDPEDVTPYEIMQRQDEADFYTYNELRILDQGQSGASTMRAVHDDLKPSS